MGSMAAAERGGAEFRILGPLVVLVDGEELPVPGEKLQALLGRLLLAPGHPVSAERLIDDLWGEEAPATARQSLHAHVTRLRRLLDADPAGGSMLASDPPRLRPAGRRRPLDAARFRQLLAGARSERQAGHSPAAREQYASALALWRGSVLEGVPLDAADGERAELEGLRFAALEERIDVDLELGAGGELVSELEQLVQRTRTGAVVGAVDAGALCERSAGRRSRRLPERAARLAELGLEPGPRLPRARAGDPRPRIRALSPPASVALGEQRRPPAVLAAALLAPRRS